MTTTRDEGNLPFAATKRIDRLSDPFILANIELNHARIMGQARPAGLDLNQGL